MLAIVASSGVIATGPVALFEESLAIGRRGDDQWLLSIALNNLGSLLMSEGDYERAVELFEESLAIGEARGDLDRRARELNNLGWATRGLGDLARARDSTAAGWRPRPRSGSSRPSSTRCSASPRWKPRPATPRAGARLLGRAKELASRLGAATTTRTTRSSGTRWRRSRLRSGPSGLRPSLPQGLRCRSRTRSTSRSDGVIRKRPPDGRTVGRLKSCAGSIPAASTAPVRARVLESVTETAPELASVRSCRVHRVAGWSTGRSAALGSR